MYVSCGTATFLKPMFRRVSRRVQPAETITFQGIWRWTSTLYSFETGHLRSGLYRLVVPKVKPFEGPSSFSCGIRSPLRSHADVFPPVQAVQARVSLVVPTGFKRWLMLMLIGWS